MIRKVISVIVLLPLAVLMVLFAVANRHDITLSLDPWSDKPVLAVTVPVFAVILIALMAGVLVGGTASWLRQAQWRRAARRAEADLRALRAENDALRRHIEAGERAAAAQAMRGIPYRHPLGSLTDAMRIIGAEEIAGALSYPALIDALEAAFRGGAVAPARHHHTIPHPGGDATLLLMPAWTAPADAGGRYLGCKVVTVFPGNAAAGEPALNGVYLLLSGETGAPLALMDARELTAWRTAAASALAARHLARPDARHLVMIGAGTLAPHLMHAHAAVRPIERVTVWNRTRSRAIALAFGLAVTGIEIEVADDLEEAVRTADIVSCATLSQVPLIHGAWLAKGAHVDLVGAFTPKMREADDAAVKRARVFVDTSAALKEAGDIAQPLRRKVFGKDHIRGDLFDLCRGAVKGRTAEAQITLFKSVGTALEDLAAAMLVWRNLREPPAPPTLVA